MKTFISKHTILLLAAAISVLTAQAQKKPEPKTETETFSRNNQYFTFDDDSSVSPAQTFVNYKDAYKHYNFTIANDKVIEMYVNGRKIPADSFYVYNDVVTKIKKQIKADRLQAIEDQKQAVLDREQAEEDRKQAVKDQAQAEEDRKQAELDRKQAEEDRKQAEEDRKQSVKDQAQAEEDKKQAVLDRAQAEEDRKQAVKDQAQAEEDRKQAEIDRKQAEADRKMIQQFKEDIVAEHIVPDLKSIKTVILNDEEFVVNGKPQPEELLKKFKAKYIKAPGYSFKLGAYTSDYGIYYKQ